MEELQRKFDKIFQARYADGNKIGVAVSGGADSMCLLSLVLSSKIIDKSNVVVCSVDHKIRGENSKKDLQFVEQFCSENCITFIPLELDVPALCAVSRRSVELEAREGRYGLLQGLYKSGVVDVVLTAHHAYDNAESVVMNMFRGCGIDGLCGIKTYRENYIFRPLLGFSKAEILSYLDSKNISYVTDESNSDSLYTRNFMRNEVFELVKEKYPSFEKAINNLSRDMEIVCDYLDSQLDKSAIEFVGGVVRLRTDVLSNMALSSRYIFLSCGLLGVECDIERTSIESVLSLVKAENGAGVDLPRKIRAVKEYDYIALFINDDKKNSDNSFERKFIVGNIDCKDCILQIKKSTIKDMYEALEYACDNKDMTRKVLYFDSDKIESNAVFRFRQDGDVFCPYGGRRKKLKDYLIDKKIPKRERDKLVVLAVDNSVKMIVGVEIANEIAVEQNSSVCTVDIIFK